MQTAQARFASVHRRAFADSHRTSAEHRSWAVIWLCLFTTIVEVAGGLWSGSIALVADGLHTSTHVAVLLMAALAYRATTRLDGDPRFAFGTGKIGDLAGFASGVVLALIAMLIGWDAANRFISPVPIGFSGAIGLAVFGLVVNGASVWLLREAGPSLRHARPHRHLHRDNNLRAIIVHILGDAAVSILVICGLVTARASGALWLDPAAGLASAALVLWLARTLVRDTGAILLDMNPGGAFASTVRGLVEAAGGRVSDLHLWRIGPGRLAAVLTIVSTTGRQAAHYRAALAPVPEIAHLTIEVR